VNRGSGQAVVSARVATAMDVEHDVVRSRFPALGSSAGEHYDLSTRPAGSKRYATSDNVRYVKLIQKNAAVFRHQVYWPAGDASLTTPTAVLRTQLS